MNLLIFKIFFNIRQKRCISGTSCAGKKAAGTLSVVLEAHRERIEATPPCSPMTSTRVPWHTCTFPQQNKKNVLKGFLIVKEMKERDKDTICSMIEAFILHLLLLKSLKSILQCKMRFNLTVTLRMYVNSLSCLCKADCTIPYTSYNTMPVSFLDPHVSPLWSPVSCFYDSAGEANTVQGLTIASLHTPLKQTIADVFRLGIIEREQGNSGLLQWNKENKICP